MASVPQRTFMKDLQQLYKTIDASTDGQASIVGVDEMAVKVSLRPKAGYNAHAEFLMTIECCGTYPATCPKFYFNTPIFHPNIDPISGSMCLSIFDDWRSCYSLLDLVKACLYLIDHPNFDSPYGTFGFAAESAQLAGNSARLLAGLPVNGLSFPPNPAWVEWARVSGCLPSEEEGELGETEVGVCKNEEFDQKGYEGIDEAVNIAASEDERPATATLYASSDITSDTVPSFAKVRYLYDPEGESISWGPYVPRIKSFEFQSQRILIWPPTNAIESSAFSVFFFIEFLGTEHHLSDLGQNYSTLFIGSVLHECQPHPESRQTSSSCPWYAFDRYSEGFPYSYSSYSSSLNLSKMFADDERAMHDLTADFCPWSALDGKGMNALFGGLFFLGSRNRGNFICFLDEDNDDENGSQGIGHLFDLCSSDHEEDVRGLDDPPEAVSQCWFFNHAEQSISESEDSLTEKQGECVKETDDESQKAPSSVSSTTYKEVYAHGALITECFQCRGVYLDPSIPIDGGLALSWKCILQLTRWPFRFAPQQSVDISMLGIQVPLWRASSGRMVSDVGHFCAKNQDISNLVLLDPMALSPLSPLLNLMRYQALPRPRLTGVLWMTPLDALSPFYHVPVPLTEQQKDSDDEAHEVDGDVYPTPTCLRFLTITAYLTNWVAWMSRMESYAALGVSRLRPFLISAPVAAHVLQPYSLGCGQAPLLDLWPMWLLRRLLTLSLKLSQLHIPFLHCNNRNLQYLFPFADIDEI